MQLYRNRCSEAAKRPFPLPIRMGALAALLGVCWLPCRPLAAWRVQIQDRSALSAAIRVNQDQWILHGTLVDGAHSGLAYAAVSLHWASAKASQTLHQVQVVKTNHLGDFEFRLTDAMVSRRGHVELRYDGDARYGPCSWTGPIEPSELPLGLRVLAPDDAIDSRAQSIQVAVVAIIAGAHRRSLNLQLWFDGREVHQSVLPRTGRKTVSVPLEKLVDWSPKTLRARVVEPATGRRAEASSVVVFRRHLRVKLAETSKGCQGDMRCLEAHVEVMLAGGRRVGAAQMPLRLLTGDDEIDAATTNSKGFARLGFYGPRLAALYEVEDLLVHVATPSKSATEHSVTSNGVVVSVGRSAVDQWAASALLLALVAFILAWAGQRLRQGRTRELAVTMRSVASPISGALAPDQRTIRGQVIHSETAVPTACDVWLQVSEERLEAVWDSDDSFRFERLPEGRVHLHVHLDEHLPLELSVDIPHDGGFDGCQLRPQGHRRWIRDQFAAVLARRARLVVDWRRHTPRRLEDAWMRRQRSGHDRIRHAVDLSDQALYGPHTDWDGARAASDALKEAERS